MVVRLLQPIACAARSQLHAARDAAALVGSECGELEDDGERPED